MMVPGMDWYLLHVAAHKVVVPQTISEIDSLPIITIHNLMIHIYFFLDSLQAVIITSLV